MGLQGTAHRADHLGTECFQKVIFKMYFTFSWLLTLNTHGRLADTIWPDRTGPPLGNKVTQGSLSTHPLSFSFFPHIDDHSILDRVPMSRCFIGQYGAFNEKKKCRILRHVNIFRTHQQCNRDTVDGIVNWCNPCGKQDGDSSEN